MESAELQELTGNGTAGAASPKMVDNGGVALDDAVHVEVAAKAGVGDFLVLEALYRSLDRLGGSSPGLEKFHAYTSCPVWYVVSGRLVHAGS